LSRARYSALFGPTTGDRIRLADTDLIIEITEDRSGGPGLAGDEAVFGGGKVLRESMGQARATRAETRGFWSGVMHADRGAVPVLRHRVELGDVVDDELAAPRAYASEFRYPEITW
jgi:hypothetical protein